MRSRSTRRWPWILAGLVLPVALPAQGVSPAHPAPRGITLAEALEIALRQNLEVRIAQSVVDSAEAERRIARAWPNPVLAGIPNSPYQYSVSLPLDVLPQRFLRSRVASVGARAAELDRRDLQRQTALAVARAFFDAQLAEERRRLAEQRREAVARVLEGDSIRFRAGDVPQRNLLRSEVELARADGELARVGAEVQGARIVLQGLMGFAHPDTVLGPLGSLEYRRLEPVSQSLVDLALVSRPDLLAGEERVQQSEGARRSATALLLPTPELSYVRQYAAPFENGRYYSIGLSFELPSLNRYGGQRARAAAGVEAARLAEQRTRAQLEREVATALTEFRIQRALVEQYQSGVLPRVSADVAAALYAYQRGAASLLELLDALRVEQDIRNEYLTALRDYWVSVYHLNAAVGVDVLGAVQ